jgi:starch-binding outer membrane protein, SusD/RagB family
MKNKLLYSFLVVALMLVSCDKELINIDNPNIPTTATFWKTAGDADLGLTACYNSFYRIGTFDRWLYFRLDLTSDEGYSKSPWNELKEWTRFIYFNYDFWEGNRQMWQEHYQGIFRCNQVLRYVPDIDMDASDKSIILAQAKFIRALYYYNLAIMFDNCPLVLDVTAPDDQPLQNTEAQVYAQVILDLGEAAAVLPQQWGSDDLGRPTKGAALALQGKAYMQIHDWQNAKDALEYLVEGAGSSIYELVPNYRDNFKHTTENNAESVFEIQFSDVNPRAEGDRADANVGSNRAQFFAPRGIGWCDGQPRNWLVDEYKKEKTTGGEIDPRLRDNLFYPELQTDFPGEKIYGGDWRVGQWGTDVFFRKYQGDYYRDHEDYYSPINYRLIRYADVLLLYAECLAELSSGAPPALAIECVDRVRERVGLSTLATSTLYSGVITSKTDFLKRLQMERSLELCLEGFRWADLKRWKLWDTTEGLNELISRDPDFSNFVVGKSSRLPIPLREVDNNPNLDQNPNY